jgi:NADP-dependent 3-hydroxy acid dehydrogenase YdfG
MCRSDAVGSSERAETRGLGADDRRQHHRPAEQHRRILPQFQKQGGGHFVTVASTAAHELLPAAAVYCATKFAARAITEGLRLESDPSIRVTTISPGVTETELLDSVTDPAARELTRAVWNKIAISPDAVASAISYAVSQPADVDVNEIVIRPAGQRWGWLAP